MNLFATKFLTLVKRSQNYQLLSPVRKYSLQHALPFHPKLPPATHGSRPYSTSDQDTWIPILWLFSRECQIKFCQAQFKFSTSSVQFELRLSLKPGYYHPHPPTPTRGSRDTATFGLPRALKFCMEALFNQTKSTS